MALPLPKGVLVPLFILQAVLLSEGVWPLGQQGLAVHLEQGCPRGVCVGALEGRVMAGWVS